MKNENHCEAKALVSRGSQIHIRASGSVHPCDNGTCANKKCQQWIGPDGFVQLPRLQTNALPDMALIARIGNWGPIYLGSSRSISLPAEGMLYLGVNDGPYNYSDNAGSFVVTMTSSKQAPSPN